MSKRRVKTSRRSEQQRREIIMNKIKENVTGVCRWFIKQPLMLHFSLLPFLILILIYVFGSYSFRVDIEIRGIDRYLLYLGFFLLFFYWLFWETRITKNPAASGFIKFILTIFLLIFNLWLALVLL